MRIHARQLGIVAFLAGCGANGMPTAPLGRFEHPQSEFSAIRYADRNLVSANDRCPVTLDRLNPAIQPVYVNARPIGFC